MNRVKRRGKATADTAEKQVCYARLNRLWLTIASSQIHSIAVATSVTAARQAHPG